MCNLFFRSLKRHLLKDKTVSVILFFGVFVAVLCISISLGYATGKYTYTARSPRYATITVQPGAELLSDIQAFPEKIDELLGESISNILYLDRDSDSCVIIGWQGLEAQRWFPITGGRFFTEEEQSEGSKVAFISYEYLEQNNETSIVLFSDDLYSVVGTGWIAEYNIRSAMSKDTLPILFPSKEGETTETYFKVIPYRAFLSNSIPDLILIHFDFASTADLLKYSEELSSYFPDSSFSMPQRNSDDVFISENINGMVRSIILGLIASITIVQLAAQWMVQYKKEMLVYRICGMRKRTCILILLGHWAIVFVFASVVAVVTHNLCSPLLKVMDANFKPELYPLAIVLFLIYITTSLMTVSKMRDVLNTQGKGEQE